MTMPPVRYSSPQRESSGASERKGTVRFMANTQEIVLSVPDVSCEHCVRAIYGALGGLHGVEAVNTDIPSKTVRLRYDAEKLPLDKINEDLVNAGYTDAR